MKRTTEQESKQLIPLKEGYNGISVPPTSLSQSPLQKKERVVRIGTKKKWNLYWREFDDFRGSKMGVKVNGVWNYSNRRLMKFGYEDVNKNRVEMNTLRESVDRWVDLWGTIETVRIVEIETTREHILRLEKGIHGIVGEKDFWMENKPNGITEFRLYTEDRKKSATQVFNLLEENFIK